MQITVADEDAPRLDDPEVFTAFSVAAPAGSAGRLDDLLGDVGRFDGEHAWIPVTEIRRLAGERGDDQAWQASLEGMVSYAAANGFASDDGETIRAHVEWAAEAN